ncbi:MAG: SurA N-terminal domain-containing protein [Candidatus Omnitrophica bacterium]|nr:SurA N-terminal domain-containing protein [Candidatus Omnitrophota bacterium]
MSDPYNKIKPPNDQAVVALTKKILLGFAALCVAYAAITTLLYVIKPKPYVGEIFGKKIHKDDFDAALAQLQTQSRLQYGRMYDNLEGFLDFHKETWDQLILLEIAKKRGIQVEDQQVVDTIASFDFFYRKGQFDQALYKDIIRVSLQSTPSVFEESIRNSLIMEKLQDDVTKNITFSDEELKDTMREYYKKVQFASITVPIEYESADVSIPEEDARKYFNEHKADFLVTPSVQVDYVRMDFPEEGGIQKQVETKYKGIAIYNDYIKDKDLTKAAVKQGFEVKTSHFFTKLDPDQDIDIPFASMKDIFQMKKGEISQPIEREEKGWLIIRMRDKKDAYVPQFIEVKDKVIRILAREAGKELALKKAQDIRVQLLSQIKEGGEIERIKTLSEDMGITFEEKEIVS